MAVVWYKRNLAVGISTESRSGNEELREEPIVSSGSDAIGVRPRRTRQFGSRKPKEVGPVSTEFSEGFDALLADAMSGKLTRRQMIKRGAALGLSAPLAIALLRARGVAAQTAGNVAPGATIVVPQGLRTDLKGKKITWIGSDAGNPDRPWELAAIKKFTDATGIEVTDDPGPKTTDDRLTKYLQLFAAHSPDLDVAQIDVIDIGVVAPYAVDLSQNSNLK